MRRKTYRVISPIEEREELRKLTRTGRARAREILRANILLKADEGGEGQRKVDAAIAKELQVSLGTVATTRQRYVSGGLERALHDRSRSEQLRGCRHGERRRWWQWSARSLPRGGCDGRWSSWPTGWCS
jgi:hypothetical protein